MNTIGASLSLIGSGFVIFLFIWAKRNGRIFDIIAKLIFFLSLADFLASFFIILSQIFLFCTDYSLSMVKIRFGFLFLTLFCVVYWIPSFDSNVFYVLFFLDLLYCVSIVPNLITSFYKRKERGIIFVFRISYILLGSSNADHDCHDIYRSH